MDQTLGSFCAPTLIPSMMALLVLSYPPFFLFFFFFLLFVVEVDVEWIIRVHTRLEYALCTYSAVHLYFFFCCCCIDSLLAS